MVQPIMVAEPSPTWNVRYVRSAADRSAWPSMFQRGGPCLTLIWR